MARTWSHSQELWCCQRKGQGTATRPSPSRQERWWMASSAGRARMPGQVMRAGQASSQAAPSFPSQVWMINTLPGQAGEKDPSLPWGNWETGVEEKQHNLLLPTGHSLSFMQFPPKARPPPQCQQQLCTHGSTGRGLGLVISTPVTQKGVQVLPHPALLSPLPPALASPEHGK